MHSLACDAVVSMYHKAALQITCRHPPAISLYYLREFYAVGLFLNALQGKVLALKRHFEKLFLFLEGLVAWKTLKNNP